MKNAFYHRIAQVVLAIMVMTLATGCQVLYRIRDDIQASPISRPFISWINARRTLSEGIDLYENGDFNGTIKHLTTSPYLQSADVRTRTKALKYTAFSYCLTSRHLLCRRNFEKAFRLDPNFDLEIGEKGHPSWDHAFKSAKKTR